MSTEVSEQEPDFGELAEQLVAAAKTRGVDLTGPGGLLTGLTKQVQETALESELTEHLGHDRHERSSAGNAGNGSTAKRFAPMSGMCGSSCPAPGGHVHTGGGA